MSDRDYMQLELDAVSILTAIHAGDYETTETIINEMDPLYAVYTLVAGICLLEGVAETMIEALDECDRQVYDSYEDMLQAMSQQILKQNEEPDS